MVSLDDLKDLKLYKKNFFLPIDKKNKKKNSLIMLLTPNYKSSISCMKSPYMINRRYFESYYLEKNVFAYINNESLYYPEDCGEYLFEVARNNPIYDLDKNNISEDDIKENSIAYDAKYHDNIISKINNVVQETDKWVSTVPKNSGGYDYEETASLFYLDKDGKLLVGEDPITNTIIVPTVKVSNINTLEKDSVEAGEIITGLKPTKLRQLYTFTFSSESYKNKNRTYVNYNHGYAVQGYTGELGGDENFVWLKFLTPGQVVSLTKPLSKPLKYFVAKFGTKLANKTANDYANKKLGGRDNIIFSGYSRDLDKVKRYITMNEIRYAFNHMDISIPDYPINITVTPSESDLGYIDERNIVIYSLSAYKKLNLNLSYKDYITYTLQLYTVYCINPDVNINIAEPVALTVSGLCDKFLKEDFYRTSDEKVSPERLYKYILTNHGIDAIKDIVRNNDFNKVTEYYVEMLTEYGRKVNYNESFLKESSDDDTEIYKLGASSKIGSKIINDLKSKSVFKLNKIKRDVERGNIGKETRGKENDTGIEKIKDRRLFSGVGLSKGSDSILGTGTDTGDSDSEDSTSESSRITYSINDAKNNIDDKDYLIHENVMYIFEADNYNNIFRKALYQDRFKNNKAVLEAYKQVKSDCPFIKWAIIL